MLARGSCRERQLRRLPGLAATEVAVVRSIQRTVPNPAVDSLRKTGLQDFAHRQPPIIQ